MQKKLTRTKRKQCSRGVVLVCSFFIITALLASNTIHIVYAGHEHENDTGCPVTLMPECFCDNNDDQVQFIIQSFTRVTIPEEAKTHSDLEADCMICIVILKDTNRLRQMQATTGTVTDSNISPEYTISQYLFTLQTTPLTLIEQKTKLSN